ncbi:MAG: hypothetical protein R6U26_01785 [Candidatus Undinarchaeales archaeon]
MSEFLKRIMQDPKKREKFFILMTFGPIIASILLVIGFILFIVQVLGII